MVDRQQPVLAIEFYAEWDIDTDYTERGGPRAPHAEPAAPRVHLLQRKTNEVGDQLGKTTGWIHRSSLKARRVAMSSGATCRRIDDEGLHVSTDPSTGSTPDRH